MLKLCDDHGTSWCVYGEEEVLRTAFDEWKSAVEACAGESEILEVVGFCDDARRTRYEVRMKMQSIAGVFLTEL